MAPDKKKRSPRSPWLVALVLPSGLMLLSGTFGLFRNNISYFLRCKWMFVSVQEPEFWYARLILVNLSLSPSLFSLFLSPVSGAEFVLLARASDEQHRCQAPPRHRSFLQTSPLHNKSDLGVICYSEHRQHMVSHPLTAHPVSWKLNIFPC